MQVIPVQAVPSQTLQTAVGGQNCTLNIYQLDAYGLFMDVLVDGAVICQGVICENANRIVRYAYLGFVGDFAWFDTYAGVTEAQPSDPVYTGLGAQYVLMYLAPADVVALS